MSDSGETERNMTFRDTENLHKPIVYTRFFCATEHQQAADLDMFLLCNDQH